MPMPKDPNAYPTERMVFEAAVANDGARYTLESEKAAAYFRHRMNRFRSLVSAMGNLRYSNLVLRLDGPTIILKPAKISGNLTSLSGDAVSYVPPPISVPDFSTIKIDEDDFIKEIVNEIERPGSTEE